MKEQECFLKSGLLKHIMKNIKEKKAWSGHETSTALHIWVASSNIVIFQECLLYFPFHFVSKSKSSLSWIIDTYFYVFLDVKITKKPKTCVRCNKDT